MDSNGNSGRRREDCSDADDDLGNILVNSSGRCSRQHWARWRVDPVDEWNDSSSSIGTLQDRRSPPLPSRFPHYLPKSCSSTFELAGGERLKMPSFPLLPQLPKRRLPSTQQLSTYSVLEVAHQLTNPH